MANVQIFAGFDVSKDSFDVCILENKKYASKKFEYSKAGLTAMTNWLAKGSHCVMEATGPYYLQLALHLHRNGFIVSVINPLVIKRFSQMQLMRAKTDKADAKLIAEYGLLQCPATWQPPSRDLIKLQQLDSLLQQLQKHRSSLMCQKEAFTASGLMDKETRLLLEKAINNASRQIDRLSQKMEAIVERQHQQALANITSIPGIGKRTAISLIVISDCMQKFTNYKQLSAYIGLSPRIYQSGSSVRGKARICKLGMSRIRALLYVCSWSAVKCNTACKQLYERLTGKGKAKKLALIAVANKLIKQVFSIVKNNRPYDKNFLEIPCF